MKIVLETNVYVSATISKGNPYHVLSSAESGETDLYIFPFILDEIEDVLNRDKIPFEDEDVERFVDKVLTIATVVTLDDMPEVIRYQSIVIGTRSYLLLSVDARAPQSIFRV